MLSPSIRDAIYSIYGFVRFADEIVDSFHGYDKEVLIDDFEKEYYKAYTYGIS
jgi:phytoene/squalene synthetase